MISSFLEEKNDFLSYSMRLALRCFSFLAIKTLSYRKSKAEIVPMLIYVKGLRRYFQFYNNERPHQTFRGGTPAEVYWGASALRKAA